MRVVHLIEPGTAGCGPSTLWRLSRLLGGGVAGIDQHAVLIGGTHATQLARRCGVVHAGRVHPPAGSPVAARGSLRRVLAGRQIDVVHCWSPGALVLATVAMPGATRIASFCARPEPGMHTSMLRVLLQRYPTQFFADSGHVREGIAALRLASENQIGVVRGSASFVTDQSGGSQWRASLDLTQDAFLVGVIGEPSEWIDCDVVSKMVIRLHYSGRNVVAVTSPRVSHRARASLAVDRQGIRERLLCDEVMETPWLAAGGLDCAVFPGGMLCVEDAVRRGSPWAFGGRRFDAKATMGTTLMTGMMSCGVPVVCEQSDEVCTALENADDALHELMAPSGDVNALCRRIARLHDDKTKSQRIGELASRFAAGKMSEQAEREIWISVYDRLLQNPHKPVEVPDRSPEVVVMKGAGVSRTGDIERDN